LSVNINAVLAGHELLTSAAKPKLQVLYQQIPRVLCKPDTDWPGHEGVTTACNPVRIVTPHSTERILTLFSYLRASFRFSDKKFVRISIAHMHFTDPAYFILLDFGFGHSNNSLFAE
jgi:hypothetical protein